MMPWLIAALLHLFPARFRREFGAEMLQTFEDRWREQGDWRLAGRTIADLVGSAALERADIRKGDGPMTILRQDLHFAARMLLRTPGFTAVALATLALGIGVNTAMFSVANAVLWRSLPYARIDRLVSVSEVQIQDPDVEFGASYLNFRDWRAQNTTLDRFAGVFPEQRVLREGPEPLRVAGAAVSSDFFDVMGVQPAAGRVFAASEDQASAPPVVVLSHHMWMERFGGDPGIVGRAIALGQPSRTVVGVMPARFEYPMQSAYWVPLEQALPARMASRRDIWVLTTVGRLRDGRTAAEARTEIEGIAARIRLAHTEANRNLTVRATGLRDRLNHDLRPALYALLGAVGLVLLITCGNLAGMMMARAASRAREIAIRSAIGAARSRLIRQLVTECALLSIAGGGLGIALAIRATHSLQFLTKDPRLVSVPVDGTVLLFAVAATVATSILFGVAPAIRGTRVNFSEALQGGARTGGSARRSLARQVLVAAEVALCIVLLVGAGLLLRSFERVMNVNPGFRPDHLATARIGMPRGYDDPALVRFYSQLPERMGAIPGVKDASAVTSLPVSGGDGYGQITIEGRPMAPGERPAASFRRTLPNYFRVAGIPLLRGRDFDSRDDGTHGRVIIVSESMAKRLWPGGDPIGQGIKIGPADADPWSKIVGVVGDVRNVGLETEPAFAAYEPLAQLPWTGVELAIRTEGDPAAVLSAVRAELRRLEPALLIDRVGTMERRIEDSMAPRRLNLALFELFAALALALAAVGLYGVVAYTASQRTREFGIRMALGARPGDVLRLVLGQGLKLALIGVTAGVIAALALTRLLVKLLFGVHPSDPVTIGGVALLLVAVALAACWLPARRATKITPTEALRAE